MESSALAAPPSSALCCWTNSGLRALLCVCVLCTKRRSTSEQPEVRQPNSHRKSATAYMVASPPQHEVGISAREPWMAAIAAIAPLLTPPTALACTHPPSTLQQQPEHHVLSSSARHRALQCCLNDTHDLKTRPERCTIHTHMCQQRHTPAHHCHASST